MVKVGKYDYQKSTRKHKKLMVVVNGKTIHFGDNRLPQFKDKTGIWSKLDHGDKARRKRFLARSRGIKNKKGELTKDMPSSANYHAIRVLW